MLSFSWGVTNPASTAPGGGAGAGKATFQDLSIVHNIDKASPQLLKACATGQHLQGRDNHPSEGGQGPAGVPHRQDERRHHHRRRRMAAPVANRLGRRPSAWRLPRWISNTSRKSPMARSTRASTSSTTSRPTRLQVPSRLVRDAGPARTAMEQSETPPRELTLEEAVTLAILLQKNEQLVEAQELYRRVLETAPNHPRRAALRGRARASTGAERRSGRAHRAEPRARAGAGGLAQQPGHHLPVDRQVGRSDRRLPPRDRHRPGHANAHSNLGVLLRATGKPSEAEAAYRRAIQLAPDHIDAYTNLGILLNGLDRTEEAAACYCKVITLRPKHREARRLLALAHCMLGEIGEAVNILEEWLEEEPGDPIALHMLRGLHGPGCAGARVERIRRENLRQLRCQLRIEAREAVVPRPRARGGHAGGLGSRALEAPRRAGRRLRNGALRPACGPVMRAGWSASTSPRGCWRTRKRRTSTTH